MKKLIKIQKNEGFARRQAGMTYVEIIVVLSIFAIMSSVIIFNYGEFQVKVDIKNMASDIALKIVEAQKSALSGKLPLVAYPSNWKPAYGVYFNISGSAGSDNKSFIYFADTVNDKVYSPTADTTLDVVGITRGNIISKIEQCNADPCDAGTAINSVAMTFTRPDSRAYFDFAGTPASPKYVQITIASPKSSITARIKVYPSGRIQVN